VEKKGRRGESVKRGVEWEFYDKTEGDNSGTAKPQGGQRKDSKNQKKTDLRRQKEVTFGRARGGSNVGKREKKGERLLKRKKKIPKDKGSHAYSGAS